MSAYKVFDRTLLATEPIARRKAEVRFAEVAIRPEAMHPGFEHPALPVLSEAIIEARRLGATVLLMFGGGVIKTGCSPVILELVKRGFVTHLATNGAGAIYDFEFALCGETGEDIEGDFPTGRLGLWTEDEMINEAVKAGAEQGIGWGEAVGKYIWEHNFPGRENSLLAMSYHLGIPCTVHIGVGCDTVHELPNADGAAMGKCSLDDFLIYTESITRLEGGVFLDFGSAVAGPEVYLKALAMARNVAHQRGERIVHFHTAVFDVQHIEDADNYSATPSKSDPRYYFRPWKTILARTVADGGKSFYIHGHHHETLPRLASLIFEKA